jgi:hypothetical protein
MRFRADNKKIPELLDHERRCASSKRLGKCWITFARSLNAASLKLTKKIFGVIPRPSPGVG